MLPYLLSALGGYFIATSIPGNKFERGGKVHRIKLSEIEIQDFKKLRNIFESNGAMFSIDETENYLDLDFNELPKEDLEKALQITNKLRK
jgi:hypothetical protein